MRYANIMPAHYKTYGFTLRYLKKPEYQLLQAIKKRYNLTDMAEVVEVALRLLYEVRQTTDVNGTNVGDTWIANVIENVKTLPNKDRTYPDI